VAVHDTLFEEWHGTRGDLSHVHTVVRQQNMEYSIVCSSNQTAIVYPFDGQNTLSIAQVGTYPSNSCLCIRVQHYLLKRNGAI
jgi:hypothetical protein